MKSPYRIEELEERLLLSSTAAAANFFARFDGTITPASPSVTFNIPITTHFFTLAGGSSELGFQVIDSSGSPLDPAVVQIKSSHNHSIKAVASNSNLANKTQSLGLFDLMADTYKVTVKADANSGGAFSLNLFLAGDANGSGSVDASDKTLIQHNLGKKAGQSGYTAPLDANLNGK